MNIEPRVMFLHAVQKWCFMHKYGEKGLYKKYPHLRGYIALCSFCAVFYNLDIYDWDDFILVCGECPLNRIGQNCNLNGSIWRSWKKEDGDLRIAKRMYNLIVSLAKEEGFVFTQEEIEGVEND